VPPQENKAAFQRCDDIRQTVSTGKISRTIPDLGLVPHHSKEIASVGVFPVGSAQSSDCSLPEMEHGSFRTDPGSTQPFSCRSDSSDTKVEG